MFVTRLASGVLLVIIALVTVITGGAVLAGTLFILSVIAFRELTKACGVNTGGKKVNSLEAAGFLCIFLYYGMLYFGVSYELDVKTYMLLGAVFALVLFLAVYVFTFPAFRANQASAALFSFFYAPVMLSFVYMTRLLEYGNYAVWMIFISSWGCDTCAYCAGVLLGRHKLAPKLSPKKSVEGAVGGVAGAAALGALYGKFIVERSVPGMKAALAFAVIGAVGAVISQIGDLAASGIKRDNNIKDYGKLIPGHGGIMDRFDSVIFTAPMIYFLTVLLMK